MKGRSESHVEVAATTAAAADEWVNGSWTVDCICGVNFDDGEEMVNCDECGVWVHTRCSRYVKGDKSFACDKCKNNRADHHRQQHHHDSEETEVAQLLVELPTKTIIRHHHKQQQQQQHKIKMNTTATATNANGSIQRRAYRLWTERPLEERVHVQGIPGGDPSLFQSPTTTSIPLLQLWKSSGYIPKPFNFRYVDEHPLFMEDPYPDPDHKGQKLPLGGDVLPSCTAKPRELPSPPDNNHLTAPTPLNKQGFVSVVQTIQGMHADRPISSSDLPKSKPDVEDIVNAVPEPKNMEIVANSETVIPLEPGYCSGEPKSDFSAGNDKGVLVTLPDMKSDGVKHLTEGSLSPVQECQNSKLNEAVAISSQPLEQNGLDSDKGSEAMMGSQFRKIDGITDNPCDAKPECEGSKGSAEVQKMLSESKEAVKVAGHISRPNGAIPPPPPIYHKKVSVGRSSLTPPAIVFSRSSHSDKSRSGSSQTPILVAKRSMSSSSAKTKKETLPVDLEKNDDKHEISNNSSKDNIKPCISSSLKPSQPGKTVSSPTLRHNTSVGRESTRQSSLKVLPVESSSVNSVISEPAGTPQTEHALLGQNKNISFGLQQQGERVPYSNLPSSSKSIHSLIGLPLASSNSPAGLSDEELALLLHQELNSSPRVPRVPRVRHAGSLPQLSSAAATNMLSKRTSSSGGKDQNTFSRRKSKDVLKDGSRASNEQDSEVRKNDRAPSSSDSLKKSDASTQAEGINEPLGAEKKKYEKSSTSAANSNSFSTDADDLKNLSARVNNSEDGTGTKKGLAQTYRTLPGLIAEIMSTGRRMTYEELCNAVLPHWPNLRKHNGERYAYSSHSQGVLDCLRNRTEWAQLVDRGPKTSSSRKKRKMDVEPPNTESEDGDDRYNRDGDSKSFESNKEEFPRGRRGARKARRLAPQGRGVKDSQKRRKLEVGSDESGSFTSSSEESESSENDSRGSGMGAGRSEMSGSSHEG